MFSLPVELVEDCMQCLPCSLTGVGPPSSCGWPEEQFMVFKGILPENRYDAYFSQEGKAGRDENDSKWTVNLFSPHAQDQLSDILVSSGLAKKKGK